MQLDYELLPGGETIRQRLERDRRAINTLLADARTDELVVECYGAGYALLRSMDHEPEPRYVLTDQGRRDLAMAQLFDKGPTVADVIAARPALCPACQQSQDTPSCSRREHWGVA